MSPLAFSIPQPVLPIDGQGALFPVRRVWCIGSNYRKPDRDYSTRDAPYFFSKQPDMVTLREIPHGGMGELRFEAELVIAIGKRGSHVGVEQAVDLIFGHAVGLDMTRRDVLLAAQAAGKPWEIGKSFDGGAPVGPITPVSLLPESVAIRLWQNGVLRQNSTLSQLIWTVPEILSHLSALVTLEPGDLVFTGTPTGHGPCLPGDRIEARVDGLMPITASIT